MRTIARRSVGRRQIRWGVWVVLLLGLAPWPAMGQRLRPLTPRPQSYRSKQRFALEIKFGPYLPDVDSSPGLSGRTPFADVFGTVDVNNATDKLVTKLTPPSARLLTTVEFDWQFWHGFGSLGVGASAGIMRRTARALAYRDDGTLCVDRVNQVQCSRSGDRTAFSVLPLTLELVYRFDVLAKRWRVPLVPYLKGGIAYYLWWSEDADGLAEFREPDGSVDRAIGGTWGLVAHPGLAFLLDIIDPSVAQVMDAELGINHVYVFAELNYGWINGFNSKEKLVLSHLTWSAGLAFEF
jgi:hypothetical protein